LEAADGLALVLEESGWRVAWGEPDWLGPVGLALQHGGESFAGPDAAGDLAPLRPLLEEIRGEDALGAWRGVDVAWQPAPLPLRTSVRAYATLPVLVFRIEACRAVEGLATGRLARPSVAWPWLRPGQRRAGGIAEGARGFGHQFTEFSFPTFAGASLCDFFLFPHRPPWMAPVWLRAPDGRTLLVAPLDSFHEQGIAVPRAAAQAAEGLRCGWHGDLDAVPAGFASETALWAGPGPRAVLEAWGGFLRERFATERPSRYVDSSLARLSYWTDNGAAYWYRTEPGRDVPETLEGVTRSLREARVPVDAVQLDSWFYPHERTRPVDPEGQERVPPTGLLTWEPRPELLPDGVEGLRRRLGGPPLILHGRHISSASPYLQENEWWVDGDRAHPRNPAFFERWIAQAASWGAVSYEQDWLIEIFLGVRGLREGPGRSRAWQEAMDRAAAEHGLSLIWCMATPADFLQTLTLPRVTAIRTSGDYRYLDQNASNWVRFLYTNALARALGLWPFKDVFLSHRCGRGWDGDPHAEAEALLSALSAGPVGLGDRLGRTEPAVVLRTCRADGVLVKPDVPIAALDRSFRRDCYFEPEALVGEAHSTHPAGRWLYLASFNAWRDQQPLAFRLDLADLGTLRPEGESIVYDWRTGACQRLAPAGGIDLELAPSDWDLRVVCPLLPGELAVFGDVSKYATAGDRRVQGIRAAEGGARFEVRGAPGECVTIEGWSDGPLERVETWVPGETTSSDFRRDPATGRWALHTRLAARGWARVEVR
jgi:hypothetical protein